jgi:hypothetical protein
MSEELSIIQTHIAVARESLEKAADVARRGTRYEAIRQELRALLQKAVGLCDTAMQKSNVEFDQEIRDAGRRAQRDVPPPPPGPKSPPRPPLHRPVS